MASQKDTIWSYCGARIGCTDMTFCLDTDSEKLMPDWILVLFFLFKTRKNILCKKLYEVFNLVQFKLHQKQ